MTVMTLSTSALPDPTTQSGFYEGVATKRLFAWIVDVVIIGAITAIAATLPLFIGWFFYPLIFLVVSLVYRIGSINAMSATPGMRLFNIELRNHKGMALDGSEAALHTVGFLVSFAFFLPQLASMLLMLTSPRGQGLHDLFCGVAAINRPSRY
jgi:uncharacterized RDD family membrane protein YckC